MDTPLDPAQRNGGRMKLNPVPHLATARGRAYRILTAKTPAERVDFRSKTASFHSKFDHSLLKIERGTGGGYLLEKKFLSVGRGGCYGILSENRGILSLIFFFLKAG